MSDEFKDVSTVPTLTLERSSRKRKAGCCKTEEPPMDENDPDRRRTEDGG